MEEICATCGYPVDLHTEEEGCSEWLSPESDPEGNND